MCKIIGIRTVQIVIHNGVERILTDVRHIPDLKKNLLSLRALDSIWCKIVIDIGAMRILHVLMIVMKVRKVGNLYPL